MSSPGASALREVVGLACLAPSVHNTQPWRWRIVDDQTLELRADRGRQLSAADPDGRSLVISCGAAVHHAVAGAQALGMRADVQLRPEPADDDLLARLRVGTGPVPVDARSRLELLEQRCTDRRRFTAWPVPEARLRELADAAAGWGAAVLPITGAATRLRAELLVQRAQELQSLDDDVVEEQRRWLDHSRVDGIPATTAAPARSPRHEHPDRFRPDPPPEEPRLLESSDALMVLCSAREDQGAWLRAGQSLSALWLEAVRGGLSVVPLSQVVEVPETRRDLRLDVLGGLSHPQLLLRVGWQEISRRGQRRTPRRPLAEVLS